MDKINLCLILDCKWINNLVKKNILGSILQLSQHTLPSTWHVCVCFHRNLQIIAVQRRVGPFLFNIAKKIPLLLPTRVNRLLPYQSFTTAQYWPTDWQRWMALHINKLIHLLHYSSHFTDSSLLTWPLLCTFSLFLWIFFLSFFEDKRAATLLTSISPFWFLTGVIHKNKLKKSYECNPQFKFFLKNRACCFYPYIEHFLSALFYLLMWLTFVVSTLWSKRVLIVNWWIFSHISAKLTDVGFVCLNHKDFNIPNVKAEQKNSNLHALFIGL